MSISFTTDCAMRNGCHSYTITVKTDIKRYYERIQECARKCIDDSVRSRNECLVIPMIECKDNNRIDYVCSNCECSLISGPGYYVYCPRCGMKVDYSNHMFLKDNNKPIH